MHNTRYHYKTYNNILAKSIKIGLLFFMVYLLISYLNPLIYGVNTIKTNCVRNLDLKVLKNIMVNSSGTMRLLDEDSRKTSLKNEFKKLIRCIFSMDLEDTKSILVAGWQVFNIKNKNNKNDATSIDKQDNIANSSMVKEDKDKFDHLEDRAGDDLDDKNNVLSKENKKNSNTDDESENRDATKNSVISNGKITVMNETKYKININEIIKEPFKINFNKKNSKVLIYHTHTTEGYLKSIDLLYKNGIPVRTSDTKNNVVRVGEELSKNLKNGYGINTLHNKTVHTYPSDIGAYARSLNTATDELKKHPESKIVLDIHRDGIGENRKLRILSKVGERNAAKIMFVVGTDASGLEHAKWKENLKFALKLQDKLNKYCPGIARPIYLSKYRYNQHLANASLIIEIGGDGNLVEEALESTRLLARAIDDVILDK